MNNLMSFKVFEQGDLFSYGSISVLRFNEVLEGFKLPLTQEEKIERSIERGARRIGRVLDASQKNHEKKFEKAMKLSDSLEKKYTNDRPLYDELIQLYAQEIVDYGKKFETTFFKTAVISAELELKLQQKNASQ